MSRPSPYDQTLGKSLYKLMTDDRVLPNGRYLGFGLRRQCFVSGDSDDVARIRNYLKGPDTSPGQILSALGVSIDISRWDHLSVDDVQDIMQATVR